MERFFWERVADTYYICDRLAGTCDRRGYPKFMASTTDSYHAEKIVKAMNAVAEDVSKMHAAASNVILV